MIARPNSAPSAATANVTAPEVGRLGGWHCIVLYLLLSGIPSSLSAIDRMQLEIAAIDGAFGQIVGAELSLRPSDPADLQLRARELILADGTRLQDLRLHCEAADVRLFHSIRCDDARLQLRHDESDQLSLRGKLDWNMVDGAIAAQLTSADFGGETRLTLDWSDQAGSLRLQAEQADAAIICPWLPLGADWDASGSLSLDLQLDLASDGGIGSLDLRAGTQNLAVASPDGAIASDGLDLDLDLQLRQQAGRWEARLSGRSLGGQAYIDPVFLDLDQAPMTLAANGIIRDTELRLEQAELHHAGIGRLLANGTVTLSDPLQHQLDINVRDLTLDDGYRVYLQPFLIGGALDNLDTEGRLRADLRLLNADPVRLFAELEQTALRDRRERFHVEGLAASVVWPSVDDTQHSWIGWSEAGLYRVALGATDMQAQLLRDGLRLLATLRLPVENGRLLIHHLELTGLGSAQVQVDLDAELEPLSLNRLSRALGWPELGGRIGGRLPGLRYQDGEIIFDGALRAELFDGQVTIDGLRLRDPLGVLPTLQADATIRNLDLEQVTSTFEIGRITGRLHADIDDLMLENWQPARFNARLYTPEDDRSARRISQRAINTISSVSGGGGGATALLQRSALQFFDTFRYDRLALACELRDEICHMDGLEERDGGYVIIRGSGLPRIDVLGFNRRVSWPVLIEQLGAVMEQQEQNEAE